MSASVFGDRRSVVTDDKPRCEGCRKVLAWHVTRPWSIRCPRCRRDNAKDAETHRSEPVSPPT